MSFYTEYLTLTFQLPNTEYLGESTISRTVHMNGGNYEVSAHNRLQYEIQKFPIGFDVGNTIFISIRN